MSEHCKRRMRLWAAVAAAALLAAPVCVKAETGSRIAVPTEGEVLSDADTPKVLVRKLFADDKLAWEYDSSGTITIMGNGSKTGAMPDYYDSTETPWSDYSILCKGVVIGDGVTHVGEYSFKGFTSVKTLEISFTEDPAAEPNDIGVRAFEGCTGLETITINDTVNLIGGRAFSGCISLKEADGMDNVFRIDHEAFMNCASLESIDISSLNNGSMYASIPDSVFQGCSSLKSVIIPSWLSYIGDRAFKGCKSLSEIRGKGDPEGDCVLPDTLTTIRPYAFYDCDALESMFVYGQTGSCDIDEYAFSDCDSLKAFTCHDGVRSIGAHAFENCPVLSDFDSYYYGVDKLASIGERAFYNCPSIRYVEQGLLSDYVGLTIGDEAFAGCTGILSVSLPDTVASIGKGAFSGCTALVDLKLSAKLEEIPEEAFEGCERLGIRDSINTQAVYIGNNIKRVGNRAFEGCSSLKRAGIDTSVVEELGEEAFKGCTSLAAVDETGPGYSTGIGTGAFEGCTLLGSDGTLTVKAADIGDRAFKDCTGITVLDIKDPVNTHIGSKAFEGCGSIKKVTVGPKVETIDFSAFAGCESLTTAVLSSGIKLIKKGAFEGCSDLTMINIPGTVQVIDPDVFKDSGLKLINYGGTAENFTSAAVQTPGEYKAATGIEVKCVGDTGDKCGENVTWKLESGTLTIKGYGDMYDYSPGGAPWAGEHVDLLRIEPDEDKKIGLGDHAFRGLDITNLQVENMPHSGISRMGDGCFADNDKLTLLDMPEGVTDIGDGVFENCTNLSVTSFSGATVIGNRMFAGDDKISLTDFESVTRIGDYAFEGVDGPFTVDLSGIEYLGRGAFMNSGIKGTANLDKLTQICDQTFENCTGLTDVKAPGVTGIGMEAFSGCKNLKTVTGLDNVASVGDRAFLEIDGGDFDAISMPADAFIGDEAFKGCTYLKKVEKLDALGIDDPEVGDGAFMGCNNLAAMDLSHMVSIGNHAFEQCDLVNIDLSAATEIGAYAFEQCVNLANPGSLKNVRKTGESAFENCNSMTGGTEGLSLDSIEEIGAQTFKDCPSLSAVKLGDNLAVIGYSAFDSSGIESIVLPAGVSQMGGYVFNDCIDMTEADLGSAKLTSLPSRTFSNCSKLTKVKLPDSITSIGSSAFDSDSLLKEIVLPAGVKTIGESAFSYCDGLTSIKCGDALTDIGREAFTQCTDLKKAEFPVTLKSVQEGAFYNNKLESVKYAGTMEEWDGVDIASNDNEPLLGAAIECSDGVRGALDMVYTGNVGVWLFDPETGTLTIKGRGYIKDYPAPEDVPWYKDFKDSIKNVVIMSNDTGNYIYSLGANLFNGYDKLTDLTIYDDALRDCDMGDYTFYNCKSLEHIGTQKGLFKMPGSDEELNVLPYGRKDKCIKTLKDHVFEGCDALKNLVITDEVDDDFLNFPFNENTGDAFIIYTWNLSDAYKYCVSKNVNYVLFDDDDIMDNLNWYTLSLDLSENGTLQMNAAQTETFLNTMKEYAAYTGLKVLEENGDAIDVDIYYTSPIRYDIRMIINEDGSSELTALAGNDIGNAWHSMPTNIHIDKNLQMAGKTYFNEIRVRLPDKTAAEYKEYEVSFYEYGGTGAMEKVKVQEGLWYTLPMCDFYPPEGKEFEKWDKGEPGDKIQINSDVVVQARWMDHVHSLVPVEEKQANCLQGGNIPYWFCPQCSRVFKDEEGKEETTREDVITSRDYTKHVWGEYYTETPPTINSEGRKKRTCTLCGEDESQTIPRLGHKHTLEYYEERPATCRHDGKEAYYECKGCWLKFRDEECTQNVAHDYELTIPRDPDAHVVSEEPYEKGYEATCENTGCKKYWRCTECWNRFADKDCTVLIEDEGYIIPAKGHDPETVSGNASTCSENGFETYYHCKDCGNYYRDPECTDYEYGPYAFRLDLAPHTLETVSGNASTCTEYGTKDYYKCTVFGRLFMNADGTDEFSEYYLHNYVDLPLKPHTPVHHEEEMGDCMHTGKYEYWSCSECGNLFNTEECYDYSRINEDDTIMPLQPHTLAPTWGKDPTCTGTGVRDYWTCEVCHKIFGDYYGNDYLGDNIDDIDLTIPEKGHNWGGWAVAKKATPQENGLEIRQCRVCGAVETEPLYYSEGHVHSDNCTHYEAKEPNCSESGNREYWKCNGCGACFADSGCTQELDESDTELPADPEVHVWGEWEVTTAPTVSSNGAERRICTLCGAQDDLVTPPEGHVHTMVKAEAADPGCTDKGCREHWECSECHLAYDDEAGTHRLNREDYEIRSLGHAWSEWEIRQATDTQDGEKKRTCSRCGETESVTIPHGNCAHDLLDHHFALAPSCESDGNTEYWECRLCGKLFKDWNGTVEIANIADTAMEKTGHKWTKWYVDTPATEEADGKKVRVCLNCGNEESEVIPKTAGEGTVSGDIIKLATTDKSGKQITLGIDYTRTVSYNGMKHVEKGGKASKSAVADIEIKLEALNKDVLKNAVVTYKFKNNKFATAAGKDAYFIVSLKPAKGISPEDKKVIKSLAKELKRMQFKFTVDKADLNQAKNPQVKGSADKPKGLTVVIGNDTITLKKKDFTYAGGVFTGQGNFKGSIKVK